MRATLKKHNIFIILGLILLGFLIFLFAEPKAAADIETANPEPWIEVPISTKETPGVFTDITPNGLEALFVAWHPLANNNQNKTINFKYYLNGYWRDLEQFPSTNVFGDGIEAITVVKDGETHVCLMFNDTGKGLNSTCSQIHYNKVGDLYLPYFSWSPQQDMGVSYRIPSTVADTTNKQFYLSYASVKTSGTEEGEILKSGCIPDANGIQCTEELIGTSDFIMQGVTLYGGAPYVFAIEKATQKIVHYKPPFVNANTTPFAYLKTPSGNFNKSTTRPSASNFNGMLHVAFLGDRNTAFGVHYAVLTGPDSWEFQTLADNGLSAPVLFKYDNALHLMKNTTEKKLMFKKVAAPQ